MDSIEENVTFTTQNGDTPYQDLYNVSGNLRQIDRYKILLPNNFVSTVFHFHPIRSINKVFLYHSGHSIDFHIEDVSNNNDGIEPGLVIPALLKEGYDVVAVMMPLAGNSPPVIEVQNVGRLKLDSDFTAGHNLMFDYLKHPYICFVDDLLATVNYLKKNYSFSDIYLMGLSGGGWTTTLYAALDPRIRYSFPVAGSIPNYLREDSSIGDAEQGYYTEYDPGGLYSIANYEELYVLGSYGNGRRQIQILNEFDDCCFYGKSYPNWNEDVKATVKLLGKGEYDFYLEQNTKTHKVSQISMNVILTSIDDCGLKLINKPPVTAAPGERYYFKPDIGIKQACKSKGNIMYSLIIRPEWLTIDKSGVISGSLLKLISE